MKALKQVFGGKLQQYTMALALIALVVVFNVISGGRMLTSSNFQNLISGNAYVLILAIGMVMVIVIGQIDLSVGSVAGFVGMSVAISIAQYGFPWWAGLLLGSSSACSWACGTASGWPRWASRGSSPPWRA